MYKTRIINILYGQQLSHLYIDKIINSPKLYNYVHSIYVYYGNRRRRCLAIELPITHKTTKGFELHSKPFLIVIFFQDQLRDSKMRTTSSNLKSRSRNKIK